MIGGLLRLAAADILVALGGFPRLHRFVQRIAVRQRVPVQSAEELCATADRAVVWYPRQVHCLKRAAAMTWLLRAHGYPATMTIGASITPFLAHAWVEIDGRIISDDESRVRGTYAVLERC